MIVIWQMLPVELPRPKQRETLDVTRRGKPRNHDSTATRLELPDVFHNKRDREIQNS